MLTPDAKSLFCFQPKTVYLDHGGFGVTPNEVVKAYRQHFDAINAAPRVFDFHHEQEWERINAHVATRFSCARKDITLVDNATDGINVVLRSLKLQPEDEILITPFTYGAVGKAARHIAEQQGAKIAIAPMQFPNPDAEQFLQALCEGITPRTKLAIIDHITSKTALLLPLPEMIRVCHERDVLVLVDGAHAPGHIPLDIPSLQADWYVANLHKWCFVPRGCGFLWATPHRQKWLLPNVLSSEIDRPFPECFSWTGTRDPAIWLSIPAAFAFSDHFGEDKIRQHNRALIRQGLTFLAEEWKTPLYAPDSMVGNMGLVALPSGLQYEPTDEGRSSLQKNLWISYGIVAPATLHHDKQIWLRVSAQIYNSIDDFERLAKAVWAMSGNSGH